MKYPLEKEIKDLASVFSKSGFSLYLVGGAVRDYILKKENHDYDFATDAEPEDVKRLFKYTVDTGIKHGTVMVIFRGKSYEITSFRTDGAYKDGRHPESVEYVKSLSEDLKRRDFTINALAVEIPGGRIIDEHDGLRDIRGKTIRAIGDPRSRFNEDALRMMRACRFAAKLSFAIEDETLNAISLLKEKISLVSAERIKEELFSLILSDDPVRGLEYMRETGLMKIILPELYDTIGLKPEGIHTDDVYHHLLKTLCWARKNNHSEKVCIAALFHDIGKVAARKEKNESSYTFCSHDLEGSLLYEKIAERLKASNDEKLIVSHLIKNHMFSYDDSWTDAAVRRFIRRVGKKNINDLIDLRLDDAMAISSGVDQSSILSLIERINAELEKKAALSLKDLKISGKDLIENKIIKPSPEMGRILNSLLDEVIEDPSLNEKEKLLKRASELARGK